MLTNQTITRFVVRMYDGNGDLDQRINDSLFVHGAGFYRNLRSAQRAVEDELIEVLAGGDPEAEPMPDFEWARDEAADTWTLDMDSDLCVVYRITRVTIS